LDGPNQLAPSPLQEAYLLTYFSEFNREADLLSKTTLQKQVGLITYTHWLDGHEGPSHFYQNFLSLEFLSIWRHHQFSSASLGTFLAEFHHLSIFSV
jgi:hypothetical protein